MPRRRQHGGTPPSPPPGTPRLAALRLLGRRDYSSSEIVTRLLDRGYPADDVQIAVQDLAADGAIDDHRTASAHVRTSAKLKGRGAARIGRELEARGIAPEIVREALAQLTPDDDIDAIRRFLARRRVTMPLPIAERRRLVQQLLRRGFRADMIFKALSVDRADE